MRQRVPGFVAAFGLAMALGSPLIVAQSGRAPAFDVASVRLAKPSEPVPPGLDRVRILDNRVDITATSLLTLLLLAFQAKEYQLVKPDDLGAVGVHIQATLPDGATRRQVPQMLQALLTERFGLVWHREMRDMDVYVMTVRPGGTKMRELAPVNELANEVSISSEAGVNSLRETVNGQERWSTSPSGGVRVATVQTAYERRLTDRFTVVLDATRMTMTELSSVLETPIGAPVIDRTELTGGYAFQVELPPAFRAFARAGVASLPDGTPVAEPAPESWSDVVAPLGLRIERRREPVEVIVIDRISRTPTPN